MQNTEQIEKLQAELEKKKKKREKLTTEIQGMENRIMTLQMQAVNAVLKSENITLTQLLQKINQAGIVQHHPAQGGIAGE